MGIQVNPVLGRSTTYPTEVQTPKNLNPKEDTHVYAGRILFGDIKIPNIKPDYVLLLGMVFYKQLSLTLKKSLFLWPVGSGDLSEESVPLGCLALRSDAEGQF